MFQTSYPVSRNLILTMLFATMAACSQVAPKPQTLARPIDPASRVLPSVAAEFVTTRVNDEHEHGEHESQAENVNWRFWRDTNQVTTERPQLGVGELWQRDGQTIIHRKLYHADRRAIEFQDDDLKMLNSMPAWRKLELLVDSKILEQLQAGEVEWSDGYPTREYRGRLAGIDWHVVMRLDLALPALIERHHPHGSERTELLSAHPLNQVPWQPTPTRGYDVIDFADLGDKESDPFVIRVQSQMGRDHHH